MIKFFTLSLAGVICIASQSCRHGVKNQLSNVSDSNYSDCVCSESNFNSYIFAEFHSKNLKYIDPYFDNGIFIEYLNGKALNRDDNFIGFIESGKYMEYISLCIMLAPIHAQARDEIRRNINSKLGDGVSTVRDTIYEQIASLYEY